MKDERAKYLMVDSIEINKQSYKVTRKAACNDFYNVYKPNGMISAREIFETNGVPKEYQKIIIKINIPFYLRKEAQEYTMGVPFDLTAGSLEKENNKKIITVSSCPMYDYFENYIFEDKITFKTELVYSNFDDVMEFLLKVDDAGLLRPYLQSIKEFFDVSIDLDLIDEVWIESKQKPKEALKLYKKKTLNKK